MRETELDPCVHTVGLHCLYCLHEGCVCVCVRVFREQDMKVKRATYSADSAG